MGETQTMPTVPPNAGAVHQVALMNYLISMARTVETNVNRSLDALLSRSEVKASEVFFLEPQVNEMEIIIDNHAIQLLRKGGLADEDVRLIVATQKITNDLERMGDLAVNIAQCVVSLAAMPTIKTPPDLAPMIASVRAMFSRCLGALIFRNVDLASEVLQADDQVDAFRDQLFECLLGEMYDRPASVNANLQFVLATRYLERIADHTTNIAEDIIFWVRGQDVRHGQAASLIPESPEEEALPPTKVSPS